MTVKTLKNILESYNDDAEVVVVDWSNGRTYENPSVGGDDPDEGDVYCRIGLD